MTPRTPIIGIDAVAAYLPPETATLEQLHARGLLTGSVDTLRSFGFNRVHLAGDETNVEMAICAAERLLADSDVDRDEIGLILYATALTSSSTLSKPGTSKSKGVLHLDDVSDLFKYPAGMLQSDLDLPNASVIGVNQLGCASIFAALRLARGMIAAEKDLDAVLCVS